MPDPKLGFTGNELIIRVINFIGNTSTDFKTFMENALPLAEYRIFKLHDWDYLKKQGMTLDVTNGTRTYELNSTNIGGLVGDESFSPDDVEIITSPENGSIVRKVELQKIRRFDPESDDGSDVTFPQWWAPIDDKSIILYPPIFKNTTLTLDGRIQQSGLFTLTNYPTIPIRYQESFIEYLYALALDRENDDRAAGKKNDAMALIRQDIQDDDNLFGDIFEPRIKHLNEAIFDGVSGNLEAILFANISEF